MQLRVVFLTLISQLLTLSIRNVEAQTDYYNEDMITVYINNEKILSPQQRDTNKNKDTTKCEVCGKRYNDDSENASSIARTNMCSSCYKDFKATKDAIDSLNKLPVD